MIEDNNYKSSKEYKFPNGDVLRHERDTQGNHRLVLNGVPADWWASYSGLAIIESQSGVTYFAGTAYHEGDFLIEQPLQILPGTVVDV